MKKIIYSSFCILTFIKIYALPLGNPSEASLFYHEVYCENPSCACTLYDVLSLGIGFYGDYVFERHLETTTGHDIDHTRLSTNAAYLVASYLEEWDIFATLGVTHLDFATSLGPFNPGDPHPLFTFESGPEFSWSLGSRATLFEWGCTSLGIEGQYFTTNASWQKLTIASGAALYADDKHARYSEWQVGLGVSHRMNIFVPYIGAKYAHAFWNFGDRFTRIEDGAATLHSLQNQKNWGFVVGVTLSPFDCERIALTAEGRFGDERALYVNGQIRF